MYILFRILRKNWFLLLICFMLILFFFSATRKKNLNAYISGNVTYTSYKEESLPIIKTKTYANKKIHLSMQIPDDWEYVLKDGYDTFIHVASATSIQIQVLNYYPQVNAVNMESLSTSYSQRGYVLTDFQRTSNHSYYLFYQSQGMSGVTDFFEQILYDYDHVVKILLTVNDSYYEKLETEIQSCLDSVSWTYENPIAPDFILYYDSIGDFEFAYPQNWIISYQNQSLFAYDETTDASLTVSLIEDPTSISDISQLDYISFLSEHRPDFSLTTFSHDDNAIYGEATYLNNGNLFSLMQYYYANGMYHYILTYECPTDIGEDMIPLFRKSLDALCIYVEPAVSSEQSISSSGSENNIIDDEAFTSLEQVVQEKQDSMDAKENQEASSFAEALTLVCDITLEQAEEIADTWTSMELPPPVYADLISKTESDKTVIVTLEDGTTLYLIITAGGILEDIYK